MIKQTDVLEEIASPCYPVKCLRILEEVQSTICIHECSGNDIIGIFIGVFDTPRVTHEVREKEDRYEFFPFSHISLLTKSASLFINILAGVKGSFLLNHLLCYVRFNVFEAPCCLLWLLVAD